MQDLTANEKRHGLKVMAASIFSCYEGPKNPDDLIAHPEKIEDEDYKHIALPSDEVDITKSFIQKLLND